MHVATPRPSNQNTYISQTLFRDEVYGSNNQ
jgi:hypothetical protein